MIPVDTYHGVEVADPFRWLEDADSPQTRAWIAGQNEATEEYLSQVPGREAIGARLTELWDHPRYGNPVKRGGRYFYLFNDGLRPQAALLVADALDAEPRTLRDRCGRLEGALHASCIGWRCQVGREELEDSSVGGQAWRHRGASRDYGCGAPQGAGPRTHDR